MGIKEVYKRVDELHTESYNLHYSSWEYDIPVIIRDTLENVMNIIEEECPEVLEDDNGD